MKVVVASDNLVTRSILSRCLGRLNDAVEATSTSGVQTALTWSPDLAVLVVDRYMSADQITRALAHRPVGQPVYLIAFCRSHEAGELMQVAPGRGVFSVLPKPIDLRTLETHVRVGVRLATSPDGVVANAHEVFDLLSTAPSAASFPAATATIPASYPLTA